MTPSVAPAPTGLIIQPATYTPGTAAVLSIWPFGQSLTTHHAGTISYVHPAAEKDKIKQVIMNPQRIGMGSVMGPAPDLPLGQFLPEETTKMGLGYTLIQVCDTYTWNRAFEAETESDPFRPQRLPIRAHDVATMLARTFSGGRGGDSVYGNPGIAVYNPQRTLQEQLAELNAAQQLYAKGMCDQADQFAFEGNFRYITSVHRTLAKWLGYVPKNWGAADLILDNGKACPNCGKLIPKQALKCTQSGCEIDLIAFAENYGIGLDDPAVAEILEFKARKLAAATGQMKKPAEPKSEPPAPVQEKK